MKKTIKKVISLITVVFMLTSILSCGNTNNSDLTLTTVSILNNLSKTEDGGDSRLSIKDDLPDVKYSGTTFNILYPNWSAYPLYYFADEENGEVMNDVLYKRQKDVETRFDITIKNIMIATISDIEPAIRKTVDSGTNEYDLALTHCIRGLPPLMSNGYVIDWNQIDTINFSKPWWNKTMNDTLSLDGKLYFAVSDYIISEPNAVYFNKDLIKSINLEDPYKLVRSGDWTWDKLTEMAKSASLDIDGNGTFTKDDRFGLVCQSNWMLNSIPHSCGETFVSKDKDGKPIITDNIEKMQSILVKMNALFNDKETTFMFPMNSNDQYKSELPLDTGRVLFHIDPLPQAISYRGFDVDYGILPYPKFDKAQEKYLSLSWNGFMTIPASVQDIDKTGVIIEALSVESYKYCVPAYYDVLMGVKLSRDTDTIEMLNLIYNNCVYDIGMNYLNFAEIYGSMSTLISKNDNNFTSFFETYSAKNQATLDQLYEAVLKR